jgi:hypothetical protein
MLEQVAVILFSLALRLLAVGVVVLPPLAFLVVLVAVAALLHNQAVLEQLVKEIMVVTLTHQMMVEVAAVQEQ